MKYLCLMLALGVLSSCNQKAGQKASEPTMTETKTVNIEMSALASNKDYVCEMTLEKGAIGDTASYQDKIYGFCSKECKTEFLKDPQSYLTKK